MLANECENDKIIINLIVKKLANHYQTLFHATISESLFSEMVTHF